MRTFVALALAGFAFADTCEEHAKFNKEHGGATKCLETANGLDSTFMKGDCAKDNCYVFRTGDCPEVGCADLMGSFDCPTFAQCEAAWNSANFVKGAGPPTCTFFEKATNGQDGWECTDGTKCINGLDKDGFFCN